MVSPRVKIVLSGSMILATGLFAAACAEKSETTPQPRMYYDRGGPQSQGRISRNFRETQQSVPVTERVVTNTPAPNSTAPKPADTRTAAQKAEDEAKLQRDRERQRQQDRQTPQIQVYQVDPAREREALSLGAGDVRGGRLIYSGAGRDNLVSLLRERLASVGDERQRSLNQAFARTIGLTKVEIDWDTRRVAVIALLDRDGTRQYHTFHSRLDNDMKGTFGDLATGTKIAGDFVCLDLNGGCNNIRVRFVDGAETGTQKTAFVVVRRTTAAMDARGRETVTSNNLEYRRLMDIFLNTAAVARRPTGPFRNTVDQLFLSTSETVNGTASFLVEMRLLLGRLEGVRETETRNEMLMWTGPLVRYEGTDELNIPVSLMPSMTFVNGVSVPVDPNSGRFSDTIRSTRLVRNDGEGTLNMVITIRGNRENAPEETIRLQIRRHHGQVKYVGL